MKTINVEIGEQEFKKMYGQHTAMYDKVEAIHKALVGDEFREDGIIKQLKDLRQTFQKHDKEDMDNFKSVFDFQNKQKYFVGWTGQLIRGAWIVGAVIVGWLISLFF